MKIQASAVIRSCLLCLLLLFSFSLPVCADDSDVLFQTGTIDALLAGVYDGTTTCDELLQHGDLGLGTFDALEGEMVVYGDTVYQVRADGSVRAMPKETTTPFAAVTPFQSDLTLTFDNVTSLQDFFQRLQQKLPGKNLFYAIKVTGDFNYIKARSVPKQQKPYPPLAEVVKTQSIFEYDNAEGVIVGFYCPEFTQKINVPGFHVHFLSKDKKSGGHMLDLQAKKLTVSLDTTPEFFLVLPTHTAAQQVDFSKDASEELEKVEK